MLQSLPSLTMERPTRVSKFIKRLFEITSNKYPAIIDFNREGNAVRVYDVESLEKLVLREAFGHGNYSSFTRQLNNYNFSKNRESDVIEFSHPCFLKDRADLLPRINRSTVNQNVGYISLVFLSNTSIAINPIHGCVIFRWQQDNCKVNGAPSNLNVGTNPHDSFTEEAMKRYRNEHEALLAERDVLNYRIVQTENEERRQLEDLQRSRSLIDRIVQSRAGTMQHHMQHHRQVDSIDTSPHSVL